MSDDAKMVQEFLHSILITDWLPNQIGMVLKKLENFIFHPEQAIRQNLSFVPLPLFAATGLALYQAEDKKGPIAEHFFHRPLSQIIASSDEIQKIILRLDELITDLNIRLTAVKERILKNQVSEDDYDLADTLSDVFAELVNTLKNEFSTGEWHAELKEMTHEYQSHLSH